MEALMCLNSQLSQEFLNKLKVTEGELNPIIYSDLSNELKNESLSTGAKFANVCYSEKEFLDIYFESKKETLNRQNRTLGSGHHSVYEHLYFTFELTNIPKSLVMILNNQSVYVTSEKSARYTQMTDISRKEKILYDKWMDKFSTRIDKKYGKILDESRIKKLSQENARYMTSVHTPTKLIHTMSFRQLNYVMHLFEQFIDKADDTEYNNSLKISMSEFLQLPQMKGLYEDRLKAEVKDMELNWYCNVDSNEHFDSTYVSKYFMSFASLAQAQRHRTLNYQVKDFNVLKNYVVPPILLVNQKKEWLSDLESVSELFPQAGLLEVTERGIFEHFKMKAIERLCGFAQWETMNNTKITLEKYLSNVQQPAIKNYLEKKAVSKCKTGNCTNSCEFGPKLALTRKI
jgi:thymidylate synthase ThyX